MRAARYVMSMRNIVEGEKRYWLHIALGRDFNGGKVDVLGAQLEEVTEQPGELIVDPPLAPAFIEKLRVGRMAEEKLFV